MLDFADTYKADGAPMTSGVSACLPSAAHIARMEAQWWGSTQDAWRAAADRRRLTASLRQYAAAEPEREAHAAAMRAAQARIDAVLTALRALPDTHAAALLRSIGAPDLTTLTGIGKNPVDFRRDTEKKLRGRNQKTLQAGAAARKLGIMPALTGETIYAEGATATGLRLCLGDENDISATAEDKAHGWLEAYAASPGWREAEADRPWIQAERECPRYQRRVIRREVRQAQAWLDCGLRMTGPTSPAVSGFTLAACRQTWNRGKMWSAATSVLFADGASVPLATVQKRGREARRAQLYTIAKAMESEGDRRGFMAFFITLTLPGAYHPFTSGKRKRDGTYPRARPNPRWRPAFGPVAQWGELQGRWEAIRARLATHKPLREWWGISVPEPHQDGTPHLHIMVWMPTAYEDKSGRRRQTAHVLRDILRDVAPDRQGLLEVVRKRDDKWEKRTGRKTTSPASYVMKYVMMSLDDEATQAARGEDAERHRAWASSRGLRRMRLVGVHGALRVWQRLWTARADEYDDLPESAQTAWDAMRRSEQEGDGAEMVEGTEWEREIPKMRRRQAEAAADALREIGGLPGGERRLRLGYEETTTEYGRASQRAVSIREQMLETVVEEYVTPARGLTRMRTVTRWMPTGAEMQLRRQEAELVPTKSLETDTSRNGLTLVAIGPRGGASAPPSSDPDDLALADRLEALINTRASQQNWQDWCAERRERVCQLRQPPADDDTIDKMMTG